MPKPEQNEGIEAIVAQFFAPPPITDVEYEILLRNVATEMANA